MTENNLKILTLCWTLNRRSPPSNWGKERGSESRSSWTALEKSSFKSHSSLFSSGGWRFSDCCQWARCTACTPTNKCCFHSDPNKAQNEYVSNIFTRRPSPIVVTLSLGRNCQTSPKENKCTKHNTRVAIRSPYARRPSTNLYSNPSHEGPGLASHPDVSDWV